MLLPAPLGPTIAVIVLGFATNEIDFSISPVSATSGFATASSDATILFYGDITGGSVTLGSGQTITFPNNTGISISLD